MVFFLSTYLCFLSLHLTSQWTFPHLLPFAHNSSRERTLEFILYNPHLSVDHPLHLSCSKDLSLCSVFKVFGDRDVSLYVILPFVPCDFCKFAHVLCESKLGRDRIFPKGIWLKPYSMAKC